ncbi:adenine phosphoribosyltransferase [bacterium SCSIO 12741]|nr:adenine phosphoribosyltransferase [bacterium SCSIO 12741]
MLQERVDKAIRNVPDFPKPGINFKDITPVLHDPKLVEDLVIDMANWAKEKQIDAIVGVESRGFLFGVLLAQHLNVPFVMVRKKGKLPYETISYKYDLEYGSAEIEMHVDALLPGSRVLVHDDLLATGGTAVAAAELIRMQQAEVAGFAFLVELAFLGGVEKLKTYSDNIYNLVTY